jgi:hypothetical protein
LIWFEYPAIEFLECGYGGDGQGEVSFLGPEEAVPVSTALGTDIG